MPTAEDPQPRPGDQPQRDPFENLVLDEEFIRAATVQEQSGRARMLAAKWKREPPEPDPPGARVGRLPGRRSRLRARIGRRWQSWLIIAVVIGLAALSFRLATGDRPTPPPPVIEQTRTKAPPSASPAPSSPVAHPIRWTG
ncbi:MULTISPECIES: SCO2583/SCO2584 N-terminal domain-containing protein [Kitasatospora]|uniref:Uncharacterized protein n=1 Tax=Kitasatospora cystarginea TaxID=58350 RepID=A0ABP5QC17_9ACTN